MPRVVNGCQANWPRWKVAAKLHGMRARLVRFTALLVWGTAWGCAGSHHAEAPHPATPVADAGPPAVVAAEEADAAPAAPAIDAAPPREEHPIITFDAVGDIMLGSTFPDDTGHALPPEDGAKILAEVTPILSAADLAFGNLEGPLVDGGATAKCTAGGIAEKAGKTGGGKADKKKKAAAKPKPKSCYAFRVPTRYGKLLKAAGFDVLGLANNHALDFGTDGRDSSMKTLDDLGIAYSGPVGKVAHLVSHDRKIDLIAFATYDSGYNLNDLDAAKAVVADSVAHADIVIVSFHGGAEGPKQQHVPNGIEKFYGENRGDLRTFAHAMIDAGADLVIGHGPHVVRAMEVYGGRLIAYSLGNFATYGGMNLTGVLGIALVLEVHLDGEGKFLDAVAHPVLQRSPGGPRLDKKAQVIPIIRDLSKKDFPSTAVKIDADGKISAP